MAESELIVDLQYRILQDEQQQQHKQDEVNEAGKCSPTPSQTVLVLGEKSEDGKEDEKVKGFVTEKESDIADVKMTKEVIEGVFLVSKSNHDKLSENDPGEPPECSSNGTTTPSIVSTNSSPTSDLSENKSICSDKAEVSSDNSSTKELQTTTQKQRLKYSRDQLLKLMDAPASRLWPDYFDLTFKKSQGKFDLERWMKAKQDGQRSNGSSLAAITPSVPLTVTGSGMFPERPLDMDLKKSRDPRERIKEDQDGIILSPQRRSFGTGCHVSQQSTIGVSGNGNDSVLDRTRESHREISTRRIGSGRILRREEPDFGCGERRRDREERELEPSRRDHGKDWRSKAEARFDRDRPDDRNSSSVKFLQQFNSRQESGKHDAGHVNLSRKLDPSSSFRLSGHLDKRRRFFEEEEKRVERRDIRDRRYDHRRSSIPKEVEEETPEWFTRGPSSQNEYIELVGFDEAPDEKRVSGSNEMVAQEGSGVSRLMQFFKNSETQVKEVEHFTNSSPDHDKFTILGGSGRNSGSRTPVVMEETTGARPLPVEEVDKVPKNPIVVEPHSNNEQDAIQFNVEDYLGDILNFGSEEMVVQGGSRASRLKPFFKNRDSPVKELDHHLNSAFPNQKDKFNMLGFSESGVRMSPPADHIESPHFFTPISPAGKTGGDALVEMLHQATSAKVVGHHHMPGSGRLPPPSVKELLMGGKGQSLEEIEASLRKEQHSSLQQGSTLMMGPNSFGPPNMIKQQQQPHPTPAPIQAPCRKQQGIISQQNLFSDFLLKDSANNHNLMSNKPAMPNNAPTESELIARLIKSGVNPPGGVGMGSIPSINGPPPLSSQPLGGLGARHQQPAPMAGLTMPRQLSPHAPHSSTLPQQSPSRTHLMPPHQSQAQPTQLPSTSNSEIFVKLLQNNQQKLLHPGYQPQSQPHQPQQTLQHDPIKQLIGGMNNLGLSSLHPNQDHVLREAILRPDVQSLLQRVVNGQVSEAQLMAQLNSGTMTPSQREAIATVLKLITFPNPTPTPLMPHRPNLTPSPTPQSMLTGGLSLGTTSSLSPRVASPNPDAGNVLTPHMLQQARVSPLIFGGNSVPRRTPSYQELVVRAQRILQGALLKQELEKAKEKHRRKDAERTHSPNPAANCLQNGPTSHTVPMNRPNQDGSPSKGAKCQSPLAFTPTSVMRKMTAEKERLDKDKQSDGFYSFSIGENDKTREHIGRMMSGHSQNPAIHHQGMNLKVDKRIRKVPSPLPTGNSMLGPRAQMVMSGAPTNPLLNISPPPPPSHGMGPSQRHMALQTGRSTQPPNVGSIRALQQAQAHQQLLLRNQVPTIGARGLGQQHPYMHPRLAPNPQNNAMQHLVIGNNNNYKSGDNTLQVPCVGVSTTSPNNSPVNLMNLFGRDLMAKVQAGAMPELPGGKALSLEEVERIQQTQTVPN